MPVRVRMIEPTPFIKTDMTACVNVITRMNVCRSEIVCVLEKVRQTKCHRGRQIPCGSTQHTLDHALHGHHRGGSGTAVIVSEAWVPSDRKRVSRGVNILKKEDVRGGGGSKWRSTKEVFIRRNTLLQSVRHPSRSFCKGACIFPGEP